MATRRHALLVLLCLVGCTAKQPSPTDYTNKQKSALTNAQLGIAYLEKGSITRAKEKLNKALAQGPNLAEVQYSQAYFLEQTGDVQEAESAYRRAVALAPDAGESNNNYGAFLCRQQRFEEAEQAFLSAVADRQYTGTAKAYENAGLCSLEDTDYVKADKYFALALKHDPGRPNALIELADLRVDDGQYNEAYNYLRRYLKLARANARVLWLGVRITDNLHDKQGMRNYAMLLKKNFPNSPETDMLLEYMKE